MGLERWTSLTSHHMRQNYILALQSIFLLVESIVPVVDRRHSLGCVSLPIVTFLLLVVVWVQQYLLLSRPGTMKLSKNTTVDRIFIDDLPKSILLCCTAFFVALFQNGINELRQELLVFVLFQPLLIVHLWGKEKRQLATGFLSWIICSGNFLLHGFDEYGSSFVPIAISGVVLSLTLVSLHLLDQTSLASVQPTISTNFELESGVDGKGGEMQHPTAITEWRYIVSNLSHDMKTPLSALISGVDCLHDILMKLKHAGIAHNTAIVTSGPSTSFAHELCSVEDIVSSMGSTCFFMNMMINRAIDYTKISHHIPLVPFLEFVDVQDCINSCVHCINVLQSRVDVHVGPLPAQFQSQIVTDKQWFQENLTCLLSNAIKYTPDGRVDVFFEWMEHPGTSCSLLKVVVEDMGIGVTVDAAKTIFTHDPIDRSLTAGGGAGLGLYTLAKRVDTIGGLYGLSMRPDKLCGSVFWFAIPYVPVRMPAGGCASRPFPLAIGDALKSDGETRAAAPTTTGRSGAASRTSVAPLLSTGSVKSDAKSDTKSDGGSRSSLPPLHLQLPVTTAAARRTMEGTCGATPLNDAKTPRVMPVAAASQCQVDTSLYMASDFLLSERPLRILVVDDAMPILKIIRRMLEKAGHFVLEAVNGQDALDIVQSSGTRASTALDVVLMDIQMPIMDGIDAARSMRAWEAAMRDTHGVPTGAATADEDIGTATLTQVIEGDERRTSSHSDALSLSLSPAKASQWRSSVATVLNDATGDAPSSSSPSSARYAAGVVASSSDDDAQLRRSALARRWSMQSAISHSRRHLDRVLQRNQPAGGGLCDLAGLPLDDERVIRAAAEACARDIGACNGVVPVSVTSTAAATANASASASAGTAASPVQLSAPLRLAAPSTPPEMERTYRERFRASRFATDGSTRSTVFTTDGDAEPPTPVSSTHKMWIIGCSANSDAGTVAEAMAAGMDAFLPKPVTVKSLHLLLHQLMATAHPADDSSHRGDGHTDDSCSRQS